MTAFVLVHPAWLGGWSWRKVAPLLRAAGHEVHTPTLTGLGDRSHLLHRGIDLHTHVTDVVELMAFEDVERAVLVGNSSGGMVITGVAERVPERIAGLVYLDAFVPQDGQAMVDLIAPDRRSMMEAFVEREGDGWLLPRFAPPPWEQIVPQLWQVTDPADVAWMVPRLRPVPFAQFTTPLRLENPAAAALPRRYVRCLRNPHPGFDRFAQLAEETPGWRRHDLDGGHLPYISCPHELAALLLELVGQGQVGAAR
jgi:pimeloyl-ACP methyl ester carboxylesterase